MGFVPSELLFNALLDLREDSRKNLAVWHLLCWWVLEVRLGEKP